MASCGFSGEAGSGISTPMVIALQFCFVSHVHRDEPSPPWIYFVPVRGKTSDHAPEIACFLDGFDSTIVENLTSQRQRFSLV